MCDVGLYASRLIKEEIAIAVYSNLLETSKKKIRNKSIESGAKAPFMIFYPAGGKRINRSYNFLT